MLQSLGWYDKNAISAVAASGRADKHGLFTSRFHLDRETYL